MASELSFVEFVVDQLDKDCAVTFKRMFGEFGPKPSLLIGVQIEDPQWLSELVRITARELPAPKPKKRKKKS